MNFQFAIYQAFGYETEGYKKLWDEPSLLSDLNSIVLTRSSLDVGAFIRCAETAYEEWLPSKRLVTPDELIGMRFRKTTDAGNQFWLDLDAGGRLTETRDDENHSWAGRWRVTDGSADEEGWYKEADKGFLTTRIGGHIGHFLAERGELRLSGPEWTEPGHTEGSSYVRLELAAQHSQEHLRFDPGSSRRHFR